MFETLKSARQTGRAYLVAACFRGDDSTEIESLLVELEDLVTTLGFEVAHTHLVRAAEPQPKFLIGSGKAEEIVAHAVELEAEVIVWDNAISPAQQRNWEKISKLSVIDREEVILDIFGQRARTREARLQVGLALMEYSLPRLTRAWGHLGRQGGAVGAKGEGETQLEIDRRIISKRIDRFRSELRDVQAQRSTQRKQRLRTPVPVAAIVGYTNAGKSSLLRKLTGADVLVEDKLFATLDPTTRKLVLPNGFPVLLTDTVGFVRKLPHRLVESFKATLEEAATADFLIHVLDASSPEIHAHHTTTLDVLKELGAHEKPTITLFNKADRVEDCALLAAMRKEIPDAIECSAITGEGLQELQHRLGDLLSPGLRLVELLLPSSRYDLVSRLHEHGKVLSTAYEGDQIRLVARVSERHRTQYVPYEVPPKTKRRTSTKKTVAKKKKTTGKAAK